MISFEEHAEMRDPEDYASWVAEYKEGQYIEKRLDEREKGKKDD